MGATVVDAHAHWLLTARLGDIPLRRAEVLAPVASLREAAAAMRRSGVDCVVVVQGDRLNLVDGRTVRNALALSGCHPDDPLGSLGADLAATAEVGDRLAATLPRLRQSGWGWLLVVDAAGGPLGVLDREALFGLLASDAGVMLASIAEETEPTGLARALTTMVTQIAALRRSGMRTRELGRLASEVGTAIQRRAFELCFPESVRNSVCLIAMGSQGRSEQILPTDQDNALIVADALDPASLRSSCEKFTTMLIEIGYAPCPGEIMLRNPEWVVGETAFRQRVHQWVRRADNTDLMNVAIVVDATPIAGCSTMLDPLKSEFQVAARSGDGFLARFASAIAVFPAPLGFLSRLHVQRDGPRAGCLNVKKTGIFQIVHGTRSMALEHRLTETSTDARLARLIDMGVLDRRIGGDVVQAFDWLCGLRLDAGLAGRAAGLESENYIDPRKLSPLESDLLRDNLRVVMRFREALRQHFRLDLLGF